MANNMIWGIPTSLDITNAIAFARQQVNKMKCQDPEIVKKICESNGPGGYIGGGNCLQWVDDKSTRTFPLPSNYFIQKCNSDQDCKWGDAQMGYCDTKSGYCTCGGDKKCGQGMDCIPDPKNPANLMCGWEPKDVASGHCIFTNETACVNQGQLPYTCDEVGYCTSRDNSATGPQYPYTEWSVDSDGKGKCVLGNFMLRQWCENPGSRCEKGPDGSYPDSCHGSGSQPGVVDVPPFYYDKNKSQCYMTRPYCNVFGRDYNKNPCSTDKDCDPGDVCDSQTNYCVGPGSDCYQTGGQQWGEFFIGRTLFYLFAKGNCETYKAPEDGFKRATEQMRENLSKLPESTCVVADPIKIKSKILLQKNFAGNGINMYMISWKNGKNFIGFVADEVEKVYPQIVQKIKDVKHICMDKKDIKDNNLKRLYFFIASRGWVTENIDNMLNKIPPNK